MRIRQSPLHRTPAALLLGLVWVFSACAADRGGQDPAELERLRVDLAARADATPEHLLAGKGVFDATCVSCHGPAGGGSILGPPLAHEFYKPSHHADIAFLFAIQRGVRAHHWRFGDMPAVEGVDQQQAEQVVAYIRWLQQGVGIE